MKLRIFSFIIAALLSFCFITVSVSADESDDTLMPSLDAANQFALYNINDQEYIISKGLDTEIFPSSTVKIMSGLIVCEFLYFRTEEIITVKSDMLTDVSGKNMGLAAGDRLSIKSLMYAAYSCGCNDAATALAVIAAGSTENMVKLMNTKAEELGMYNTTYTNVTGMDDSRMKSTLRDIVKLSSEASRNELLTETASQYTYVVEFADGRTKRVYGINELVNKTNFELYCKSVKALNTGETDFGGACVAVYGEYEGKQFVAVALGCESEDTARFELIRDALDWAYKSAYVVAVKAGTLVGSINVTMSESENTRVGVVLSEPLEVLLRDGESIENIRYSLVVPENGIEAPVASGSVIGRYNAWYGNELRGSADVTVSESIAESKFLSGLGTLRTYITSRTFVATVISIVIFSALSVIIPIIALRTRQRNRKYVRSRGGFNLKK